MTPSHKRDGIDNFLVRLLAVCFSLEISAGIIRRLFSLKEDGTRHGHGTHKMKNRLQTLPMFFRTFTLVKII